MNKYAVINKLESELKQVECDICFARRSNDRAQVNELQEARRAIVRELKAVR